MRALVSVLRGSADGASALRDSADGASDTADGRDDGVAVTRPRAALDELDALTARARDAGLDAALTVTGGPPPMPAGLELAVYRIVQEGVTNAIRHAGAGASLRVEIGYAPQAVTVRVRDGGPPHGAPPEQALPSGGNGLVGLRERVAVHGGTLRVGAQLDGGWLVEARLPVPGRSETTTMLEVRR